jgi:hypothetical protein
LSNTERARAAFWIAAVAAIIAGAARLQAQAPTATSKPEAPCFDRIVDEGGWSIPHYGRRLRSGPFDNPNAPKGVTFTEFAMDPRKTFDLPSHYVADGALRLRSFLFRADVIIRLEAGGTPYAFLAAARGAEVGLAADVLWTDPDGSGTFSELRWNPDLAKVPSWALARLRSDSTSPLPKD